MTDDELFACFDLEYGSDGYPIFHDAKPPPPSERKLFERHCRLNCVTDPSVVEDLWQEHTKKREANRGRATRPRRTK